MIPQTATRHNVGSVRPARPGRRGGRRNAARSGVWGTGVSTEVRRLLLAVIFRHGAQWIQLRTAHVLDLGCVKITETPRVCRDGSRAVGLSSSVDDCYGLDLDEVVGREQCGDADECARGEQGDPEFRAGAGAAFLDHRHFFGGPAGDVGG